MSKPLSRERIERGYRISMATVRAFRLLAVAFTFFLVATVLQTGQWWLLVYLAFPPLWWALTIGWEQIARDTRKSQLENLYLFAQWERARSRAEEIERYLAGQSDA